MPIIHRYIRLFFRSGGTQARVWKALLLVLALNLVFGWLFYAIEGDVQEGLTLGDAIWWAMVTMTTVGYGDFYPQTFAGRYLVAYPCFIIGIGLLAYLVGVIAEAMIQNVSRRRKGLMDIKETGHIVICNFPSLEKIVHLVQELRADSKYADAGFVLVTDSLDELPEDLALKGVRFVKGDPTCEPVLKKANVTECDGVIILPDDPGDPNSDFKSFAIGVVVEQIERERGKPIKTLLELLSKSNLKMVEKSTIDSVISPAGLSGRLLVQEYIHPGLNKVVEQLITSTEGSQFYLYDTKLVGRRVRDLQRAVIEHPTALQIVGVLRGGDAIMNPPRDMEIAEGDQLVLLAEFREDFDAIENDILGKALT